MIQYSQRDPRWKTDPLGFGDSGTTIGSYGCLLTASAMVLSNYGFIVDPPTLNKKLKDIVGFSGALLIPSALGSVSPVKINWISCSNDPAPLQLIEEKIDDNCFVIVEVDASPRAGFQNHWVTIYRRDGLDKYYISDPWTEKPESETITLQQRYGFAGGPAKIITNVIIIEPLAKKNMPTGSTPSTDIPQTDGQKFNVLIDGLRVRQTPATNSEPVGMLNTGAQLVSAGDSFSANGIVWQPVVMYVATAYNGEPYIKPV